MTTATASMRIVTFRLGKDLFAADILSVERVLRYEAPRSIPNAPPWVEGVLRYEDRAVPVVDLRKRFGLADAGEGDTRPTRLLVFASQGDWVAVVVDAVLDVRPVDPGEVINPPRLFRGLSAEYLRGLVRRGDDLVVMLDVERLFSAEEQLTLHDVTVAAP